MTDPLSRSLSPSPEAVESRVGEETVILHLGNGTYYGLDPLGTHIWELLKDGLSAPAIRDRLCADYEVAPDRAEADLRRFLEDLLRHGILLDDGAR